MNKNELLKFLISVFPSFEDAWNSEDNLFREKDNFTSHGVCAEFSHFFQSNYKDFSNEQLKVLFDEIEEISVNDDELTNAIHTCFLENIAQTESLDFSKSFIGKKAENFIKQFE